MQETNAQNDLSLLRKFDLEAAKNGELLTDTTNSVAYKYLAYSNAENKVIIQVVDKDCNDLVCHTDETNLRMKPLTWVDGKPVYKDDVLYYNSKAYNADITGLAPQTPLPAQGRVDGRAGQPNAEFSRRVWLNPDGHASTGSVVVFDGPSAWFDYQGKRETIRLVEIADCHCKVRLHQAKTDTLDQFATKVRLLRDVLSEFLEHLDKVPQPMFKVHCKDSIL